MQRKVDNGNKWQCFSESNETGEMGEKLATLIIGVPKIGHNQTVINIGTLKSHEEVQNLLKYIFSKFARLLFAILKVTQDNKKNVWKNIPIQKLIGVNQSQKLSL